MNHPRELIQHMYMYLHPRDFNAARHTCEAWMTASLDNGLLTLMLKRAGWFMDKEESVWDMSCRVARECALGARWSGNGITTPPAESPFRQSALVDFSELASGYVLPNERRSGGLVFTVSNCGKYVLVAEGGMIYVYELSGDRIRVLTSVVCPRRVLAMSIDASSKRFAVAALLDGRMGLMCDLQIQRESKEHPRSSALYPGAIVESSTGHRQSDRNSLFTTRLYPSDDRLTMPESSVLPHRRETQNSPFDFLHATDSANIRHRRHLSDPPESEELSHSDALELRGSGTQSILVEDTSTTLGRFRNYIDQTWNLQLSGFPYSPPIVSPGSKSNNVVKQGIPIETGPRSLYRHLCSDDDPPRSVTICPQRQCLAFGCSAGLELHWVDALTGQDLNRWFPLTGPSDFLYFLPPRQGIDSPRKLRLISSAAHPSHRTAIGHHFYAATKPMSNSFWSMVGFEPISPIHSRPPAARSRNTSRMIPWVSDCDHYRAIPLSDGFHILFTDPESNMLCLGSDAPLGDPRRLLRKIMFVPPFEGAIPRIYAAGNDVESGPRIVASYGDTLVLFSVPSNVFALSKMEQELRNGKAMNEREVAEKNPWLQWWDQDDIPANFPRPLPASESSEIIVKGPKSVWPLFVRGQIVGEVGGLVDVAVNEKDGNGLAIWGFGLDGRARVWQVDCGDEKEGADVRVVEKDGRVFEVPGVHVDEFGQVWDTQGLACS